MVRNTRKDGSRIEIWSGEGKSNSRVRLAYCREEEEEEEVRL
jgi:hypothetical protein